MLEARKAIDTRARQIVEESGTLWALARDQAKAEHARAREIVAESGLEWPVAFDQAKAEVGVHASQGRATAEQPQARSSSRLHSPVVAVASRAASVLIALIGVGSTYLLWWGHIDICASTAGLSFVVVLVSPFAFIGLCGLCVIVVPSNAEKAVWLSFMTLGMLLCLPVVYITVVGGGMAAASCY